MRTSKVADPDSERAKPVKYACKAITHCERNSGGFYMLWTVAVILLILWALGMISSYTLGGFIHLLLVLALIVVLIRVIQGRRPVA